MLLNNSKFFNTMFKFPFTLSFLYKFSSAASALTTKVLTPPASIA